MSPAAATIRNREVVYQSNASRARRDIPFRSGVCVQAERTWTPAQRSVVGGLSNRSQSDINTHCEQGSYITLTAGISAPDAQRIAQRLQQLEISGRVLTQWSYGRIALVLLFGFVGAAPAAALISGVLTHLAMSSYIFGRSCCCCGLWSHSFRDTRILVHASTVHSDCRCVMGTCAALVRRPLSRPTNVLDAYFSIRDHLSQSELPDIAKRDIRNALNTLEEHLRNNIDAAQSMSETLLYRISTHPKYVLRNGNG